MQIYDIVIQLLDFYMKMIIEMIGVAVTLELHRVVNGHTIGQNGVAAIWCKNRTGAVELIAQRCAFMHPLF